MIHAVWSGRFQRFALLAHRLDCDVLCSVLQSDPQLRDRWLRLDPDADFLATAPEWALATYFGCEDQLEAFAEVLREALPSGRGINDVTRSKRVGIELRTQLSGGSALKTSRWLWLGPCPCYADADRPELTLLPRERRPAALRDCEPPSRPERDFAYTPFRHRAQPPRLLWPPCSFSEHANSMVGSALTQPEMR
jgi:hypothetical protein